MKGYSAREKLIIRLAALALSGLCLTQGQIHAQGMTGYSFRS